MQIKVTYDKVNGNIIVSSDIEDIAPLELNTNSVIDTDTEVSFEIAIDITTYEQSQQDDDSFNPEEVI
jgi:hypothetical protein